MTQRHRSISDAMSALLAYRNRPEEGAPMDDVPSNFQTEPGDHNHLSAIADNSDVEARIRTRPSLKYIISSIQECEDEGGPERNEDGQIVRIGRLRFSDGTQVEPAYKYTLDGDLKQYAARIPAGGIIGASEQRERVLGGDENPDELSNSNKFFTRAFGFGDNVPPFVQPTKRPVRTKGMSRAELAADLAAAWENTDPAKVTYTRCPDGIARGAQRIGDNFIGMKVGRGNGSDGAAQWHDVYAAQVDRKIWRDSIAELSDKDRAVLEAAETAGSYAEVGVAAGQSRNYARNDGGGKRALEAANDNLYEILKKYA